MTIKYDIKRSSKFKKEFRKILKSGRNVDEFDEVLMMLASGVTLPEKYRDHSLKGNWKGYRECHVQPDLLLIYVIEEDVLILELHRIGSHADLFNM